MRQSKTKDVETTAPPGSPSIGDTYIVGLSATGAWSGKDRDIAVATAEDGGAWSYRTPETGETFFDESTGMQWIYDGTNWLGLVAPFHFEMQNRASTKTVMHAIGSQGAGDNVMQVPLGADRKILITRAWLGLSSESAPTGLTQFAVDGEATELGSAHEFASGEDGHEWFGSILSPLGSIPGSDTPEQLTLGFNVSGGTLSSAYQTAIFDGWHVKVM